MTLETIYLAGGCFWGVEAYFQRIDGVTETLVGYANGNTENPSYQDVLAGSGHAETVKVVYDTDKVDLATILQYYFRVIDLKAYNIAQAFIIPIKNKLLLLIKPWQNCKKIINKKLLLKIKH